MKKIYRHDLKVPEPTIIKTPKGGQVFSITHEGKVVTLWVVAEDDSGFVHRGFRFYQTDDELSEMIGNPFATFRYEHDEVDYIHLAECKITEDLVRAFTHNSD